jgi:hypothetical protein
MTPIDTDLDEVALPTFEDDLWTALRAEHARCSRGSHRGRRLLAAAAVVAVLAGVGGVVATGVARDDDPTTIAGPSTETPTTAAPLSLEERASAAMLAAIDETIVRTDGTDMAGGPLVGFTDARTGAQRHVWYGPDGRVLGEQGSSGIPEPGSSEDPGGAIVDHCARTFQDGWGMRSGTVLDSVGGDMGNGIWVADGTEVVDGRELIRLRTWAEPDMPPPDPDTGRWERPTPDEWDPTSATYLDPETLLPVMSRHHIGEPDETRVTYTMLPRDEANLAEVLVTVPPGYTEVGTEYITPMNTAPTC